MADDTRSDSRTRILEAAESIFAEKGFEGARVDAIAKRAGVNKALIYYYFKSKDAILEVLLRRFVEGTYPIKGTAVDLLAGDGESGSAEITEAMLKYIEENRRIVSILLMEILKETPKMKDILRYMSSSAHLGQMMLRERGADVEVNDTMTGFMLFAQLIPMAVFALVGRRWTTDAGTDFDEMRRLMMQHFHSVYESIVDTYRSSMPEPD